MKELTTMASAQKVWVRVCRLDEIPDGKTINVFVNNQRFVLARCGEQAHIAQGYCSHMLYPLKDATVSDCLLTCSLHGSQFDLRDGSVQHWPLPSTQDALRRKALQVYPTRVEDDTVYVEWTGSDPNKVKIRL